MQVMPGKTFDAIVVGAGPAGSIAALHLARAGCHTLLLEKSGPDRGKVCAGGLTPRAYDGLEVPIDDLVLARTNTADLRLGCHRVGRIRAPNSSIWMIRRAHLDKRLAEGAVEEGARMHLNEPALSVNASDSLVSIETTHGIYHSAVALVATGAGRHPPVAQRFGQLPVTAAVAISLDLPARLEDNQPAILDYGVPGGYCWAFPKRDHWSVGVISRATRDGRLMRSRLARFGSDAGLPLDELRAPQPHMRGGVVPLWNGWHSMASGRVALLGDAAALADPLFGEGISCALASGRLAAAAALQLLKGDTPDLSVYDRALRETLGPHLREQKTLANMVYRAPLLAVYLLARVRFLQSLAATVATRPFLT